VTAPICPAHKKPGRYVFGSMVTCSACDAEIEAVKRAGKVVVTGTLAYSPRDATPVHVRAVDGAGTEVRGVEVPARQALDPLFDFTDCEGDDS
jgi:hypothetical protein